MEPRQTVIPAHQDIFSDIGSSIDAAVETGAADEPMDNECCFDTVAGEQVYVTIKTEKEDSVGVQNIDADIGLHGCRSDGFPNDINEDSRFSSNQQTEFQPQILDVFSKYEIDLDEQNKASGITKGSDRLERDPSLYSPEREERENGECSMYIVNQENNDGHFIEENFDAAIDIVLDELESHLDIPNKTSLNLNEDSTISFSTIKVEPLEEEMPDNSQISADIHIDGNSQSMLSAGEEDEVKTTVKEEKEETLQNNLELKDGFKVVSSRPVEELIEDRNSFLPFGCPKPLCSCSYHDNSELEIHLKYFHEGHKYHCEFTGCDESFSYKEDSQQHFTRIHSRGFMWEAGRNAITFGNVSSTTEHFERADGLLVSQSMHPELGGSKGRHHCWVCNRTFKCKSHLREHSKCHSYSWKDDIFPKSHGRLQSLSNYKRSIQRRKCALCGNARRIYKSLCDSCEEKCRSWSNPLKRKGTELDSEESSAPAKKMRNVGKIYVTEAADGMTCLECSKVIKHTDDHYRCLQACVYCGYRTNCLKANADHMMNWHQAEKLQCKRPIQPVFSKAKMKCSCGLTAGGYIWIAKHLTDCEFCKEGLSPNIILVPATTQDKQKFGYITDGYIRVIKSGGIFRKIKHISSDVIKSQLIKKLGIPVTSGENKIVQDTLLKSDGIGRYQPTNNNGVRPGRGFVRRGKNKKVSESSNINIANKKTKNQANIELIDKNGETVKINEKENNYFSELRAVNDSISCDHNYSSLSADNEDEFDISTYNQKKMVAFKTIKFKPKCSKSLLKTDEEHDVEQVTTNSNLEFKNMEPVSSENTDSILSDESRTDSSMNANTQNSFSLNVSNLNSDCEEGSFLKDYSVKDKNFQNPGGVEHSDEDQTKTMIDDCSEISPNLIEIKEADLDCCDREDNIGKKELTSDRIQIVTTSNVLSNSQRTNHGPTEIGMDLFNIWASHNYCLPLWRHLQINKQSPQPKVFNLRFSDNIVSTPACYSSTDQSLHLFYLEKDDLLQQVIAVGGQRSFSEEAISNAVNILLNHLKMTLEKYKQKGSYNSNNI